MSQKVVLSDADFLSQEIEFLTESGTQQEKKTNPKSPEFQSNGHWSPLEDHLLHTAVKDGCTNWKEISQKVMTRNADACYSHWHYILKPRLTKTPFTPEEDSKLMSWVKINGKKWKKAMKDFPGKTKEEIRNRYEELSPDGVYNFLAKNFGFDNTQSTSATMPGTQIPPSLYPEVKSEDFAFPDSCSENPGSSQIQSVVKVEDPLDSKSIQTLQTCMRIFQNQQKLELRLTAMEKRSSQALKGIQKEVKDSCTEIISTQKRILKMLRRWRERIWQVEEKFKVSEEKEGGVDDKRKKMPKKWSLEEDQLLIQAIKECYGNINAICKRFPKRTLKAIRERAYKKKICIGDYKWNSKLDEKILKWDQKKLSLEELLKAVPHKIKEIKTRLKQLKNKSKTSREELKEPFESPKKSPLKRILRPLNPKNYHEIPTISTPPSPPHPSPLPPDPTTSPFPTSPSQSPLTPSESPHNFSFHPSPSKKRDLKLTCKLPLSQLGIYLSLFRKHYTQISDSCQLLKLQTEQSLLSLEQSKQEMLEYMAQVWEGVSGNTTHWTKEQDEKLLDGVKQKIPWNKMAEHIGINRKTNALVTRYHHYLKEEPNVDWTPEEDQKLEDWVSQKGPTDLKGISKLFEDKNTIQIKKRIKNVIKPKLGLISRKPKEKPIIGYEDLSLDHLNFPHMTPTEVKAEPIDPLPAPPTALPPLTPTISTISPPREESKTPLPTYTSPLTDSFFTTLKPPVAQIPKKRDLKAASKSQNPFAPLLPQLKQLVHQLVQEEISQVEEDLRETMHVHRKEIEESLFNVETGLRRRFKRERVKAEVGGNGEEQPRKPKFNKWTKEEDDFLLKCKHFYGIGSKELEEKYLRNHSYMAISSRWHLIKATIIPETSISPEQDLAILNAIMTYKTTNCSRLSEMVQSLPKKRIESRWRLHLSRYFNNIKVPQQLPSLSQLANLQKGYENECLINEERLRKEVEREKETQQQHYDQEYSPEKYKRFEQRIKSELDREDQTIGNAMDYIQDGKLNMKESDFYNLQDSEKIKFQDAYLSKENLENLNAQKGVGPLSFNYTGNDPNNMLHDRTNLADKQIGDYRVMCKGEDIPTTQENAGCQAKRDLKYNSKVEAMDKKNLTALLKFSKQSLILLKMETLETNINEKFDELLKSTKKSIAILKGETLPPSESDLVKTSSVKPQECMQKETVSESQPNDDTEKAKNQEEANPVLEKTKDTTKDVDMSKETADTMIKETNEQDKEKDENLLEEKLDMRGDIKTTKPLSQPSCVQKDQQLEVNSDDSEEDSAGVSQKSDQESSGKPENAS
ncbi:unnamed protein product [Moneuplotes crassus]|uniref:Myb-like DNA-binding domain containing protein n=1 Tax=Euplotes crassus TaxID=5936 RepID=A0AAD1XZU0_EUPCR|nr:unnamed protein product [Moneuplotes crassus]